MHVTQKFVPRHKNALTFVVLHPGITQKPRSLAGFG